MAAMLLTGDPFSCYCDADVNKNKTFPSSEHQEFSIDLWLIAGGRYRVAQPRQVQTKPFTPQSNDTSILLETSASSIKLLGDR